MFEELSCVVLTTELPEKGLKPGDIGTIVMVHQDGEAFEVEFIDDNGQTLTVLTLLSSQIRPATAQDIEHNEHQ